MPDFAQYQESSAVAIQNCQTQNYQNIKNNKKQRKKNRFNTKSQTQNMGIIDSYATKNRNILPEATRDLIISNDLKSK